MSHTDTSSITILKALLNAKDGFVSGNKLAEQLGVSRVSVWGRMEQLRSQGFEFEAVTRKGYRILKKPESLNALLTTAYLSNPDQCPEIIFLSTIDSTNDHTSRLLANDYEAPFFVLSNQQTLGRGRMGRQWHSPPSSNLYLSFGSRPNARPDRMQLFTLWMGVYVARYLKSWLKAAIGVKWPNDIYYEGKKLAGMLTEARVDSDSLRELVFGIGLNVNQTQADWPVNLKKTATSLRELTGRKLDLNKTAALLIEAIYSGYESFIAGNIRETFETMWPEFDILKGKSIEVETRDGILEGIASGLDNRGSLILMKRDRKLTTLNSGDVHIKTQ
ncbi:MAG: biotin--[acetyl-CoA-carboxylase] ligase [Verrucomicrobia bacterium]|nr:biotin--[acetyl-CoA-carboxylase] ligase [Verrucomicrobiota bacterium]MDA1067483.1 biotin--[acetyl-CoA-carboxylase] ligase [Verrucomicrobiota bacterium]